MGHRSRDVAHMRSTLLQYRFRSRRLNGDAESGTDETRRSHRRRNTVCVPCPWHRRPTALPAPRAVCTLPSSVGGLRLQATQIAQVRTSHVAVEPLHTSSLSRVLAYRLTESFAVRLPKRRLRHQNIWDSILEATRWELRCTKAEVAESSVVERVGELETTSEPSATKLAALLIPNTTTVPSARLLYMLGTIFLPVTRSY
jgi:hypothetical protein